MTVTRDLSIQQHDDFFFFLLEPSFSLLPLPDPASVGFSLAFINLSAKASKSSSTPFPSLALVYLKMAPKELA